MGNWELDIAVENPGFAQEMEQMYLQDLEDDCGKSVLGKRNRVRPVAPPSPSLVYSSLGLHHFCGVADLTFRYGHPRQQYCLKTAGL